MISINFLSHQHFECREGLQHLGGPYYLWWGVPRQDTDMIPQAWDCPSRFHNPWNEEILAFCVYLATTLKRYKFKNKFSTTLLWRLYTIFSADRVRECTREPGLPCHGSPKGLDEGWSPSVFSRLGARNGQSVQTTIHRSIKELLICSFSSNTPSCSLVQRS